MQKYRHLVRNSGVALLSTLTSSAHACGFIPGAGLESLFSLDDPLDIMILSVLVGAVAAFAPGLRKGIGKIVHSPA